MISEWPALGAAVWMFAWGFLPGTAIAYDGRSAFWTGFVDGLTFRRAWWRD